MSFVLNPPPAPVPNRAGQLLPDIAPPPTGEERAESAGSLQPVRACRGCGEATRIWMLNVGDVCDACLASEGFAP